jgi:hypothetical protein
MAERVGISRRVDSNGVSVLAHIVNSRFYSATERL